MSGRFGRFFVDVTLECPYGLGKTAVFRQARVHAMPSGILEDFLNAGFRRNGAVIYTMVCPDCSACVPIRIHPDEFRPNRSQRRAAAANRDLEATLRPLSITSEKLALCDKFLSTRFPGRGNAALDYYAGFFVNPMGYTHEVEFRIEGRLLGVSIIDLYPNAINCVYFFFDPDAASRSPGTFNVLHLIDFAARNGIKALYLGYWIDQVAAMRYKAKFRPHHLLLGSHWVRVDRQDG